MKGPYIIYSIKLIFKQISINKIIKVLSVLILFVNTPLAQSWQWQNPKPLGDPIHQVLFIDNQTGWMAPENSTLLKTINGGITWSTIYTNIYFDRLFFLDRNEGWAIGRKHYVPEFINSIYHTTDGGLSWKIQLANTLVSDNPNIFFLDRNHGWTGDVLNLYLTKDGGKNWLVEELSDFPIARELYGALFVDTLKGWVVGDSPYGLKTTDGGKIWTRDSSLAYVNRLIAIDSLNIWGFLSGGLIKTTNGGINWKVMRVNAVFERNTDLFVKDTARIYLSTNRGFYESTDGGETWAKNSDEVLKGFSIINNNEIWGGGATNALSSKIVHSTDGGHNWSNLVTTNNPLGYATYEDVDFVDKNTGWIIAGLNILKTTDGGKSWFKQINPASRGLRDIFMNDQDNGFITGWGGTILKTTDGGINWVQKQGNTNYTLTKLSFINKNKGWIIGQTTSDFSGIILKTTDGGNNWINQTPPNTPRLVGVSFIDSLNGWAISGGGSSNDYGEVLHTTDGGNSWSIQVWGYQYNFTGILFIDTVKGFILGKKYGNEYSVYRTLNGGNTWQNTTLNPGALYDIKFINKDTGWIAGAFGNIYHTTDGGDNWEEQFSYTHQDLYGIDFIDKNNGWAVGWYGTILHTTDGGVTSVDNKEISNGVPTNFLLYQNYPNPFNPSTTIQYQIPKAGFVTLKIYDVLGREIISLVNKEQPAGRYVVNFNASGLSSGIYFYRLRVISSNNSLNNTQVKKMMLMK